MDETQRAGGVGIRKVAIKISDLWRQQQALVNDRARRKRRNVKEFLVLNIRLGYFSFNTLADHIQLAFKRVFINFGGTADEYLLDIRLRSASNAADSIAVHRRISPTQN